MSPLEYLRSRKVTLDDFTLLGPPPPLKLTPDPEIAYWRPQFRIEERKRDFLYRILRNFHYQWRHVLRNHYNIVTLRAFARAMVKIATLDFKVYEETGPCLRLGDWVEVRDLPQWKPFDADIVHVGDIRVVICHSIEDGLSQVKKHAASDQFAATFGTEGLTRKRPHNMILSITHIMLCHATGPNELKYTVPEPLLNGDCDAEYDTNQPSDLALDYPLSAVSPAMHPIATPIRSLPVELQDMVLSHSAEGPVAAAKLGCLLRVGTSFSWKYRHLELRLAGSRAIHQIQHPAESQLWFPEAIIGVVYNGKEA